MLTASIAPAGSSAIVKIGGSIEAKDSAAAYRFFGEMIIDNYTDVIVDLSECRNMDSTFMGMLLVMHERLNRKNGSLYLASAGKENMNALGRLGVTQIVPSKHLALNGIPETARIDLSDFQGSANTVEIMQAAHKALAAANSRNAERFGSFLCLLDSEIAHS